MTKAICSVEGCGRCAHGRGLCITHYSRLRKAGLSPLPTREERFWSRVDKNGPVPACAPHLGPCWLWTARCDQYGYGRFKAEKERSAHSFAYLLLVGPIPDGLEIDHLCRVRRCVNPGHLEAVTHAENVLRSANPIALQARVTHCIRGHPFDEENTRITLDGHRCCRACARIHDAQRIPRRRSAR